MIGTTSDSDDDRYFVVRNYEEQYSLWRADKVVPAGWEVVGEPASKQVCLDRIGDLWTDMRPLSLRRLMAATAGEAEAAAKAEAKAEVAG